MNTDEAMRLLEDAGFSHREAGNQIKRFRLTPGYQLCYTIGSHEILKLRQRYATLLPIDRFHRLLLEGGEIPFHLIEKRLAGQAGTGSRRDG